MSRPEVKMSDARLWWCLVATAALAAAGCSKGPETETRREGAGEPPRAVVPAADPDSLARVIDEAHGRAVAYADSIDHELRGIRGLSWRERRALTRDVNHVQIARARALGIRAGSDRRMKQLAGSGRLVRLQDSTSYWVMRKLTASAPYVTPDARAMLLEIGRRFQAQLDSLGFPAFRMEVTSVMRTDDDQEDLRKRNANASRIVSAHEFGTSVDVSHLHFAAPAEPVPASGDPAPADLEPVVDSLYAEAMDSTAERRSANLGAILGRVIREMREEGKLLVMRERNQAVYHMTVAKHLRDPTRYAE
jgi:hypothetical protein